MDVDIRMTRRLYWGAFIVRALAGLVAYVLTLYTEVTLFEDALYYEEMGYGIAREWLAGRSVDFDVLSRGAQSAWLLVVAISIFYYLTGGIRAVPLLLVAYSAVTAVVPVFVYRIAHELGLNRASARQAGWLVALSPAFVFWSGSLYKEGLVMLALGAAIYHTLRLQARWRSQSLVLLALSLFMLLALRFYLAILMSLVVVFGLLWGRREITRGHGSVHSWLRQASVVTVFIGLMVSLGFNESAERRLEESPEGGVVELDLTRINVNRQWSSTSAESGYLPETDVSTPLAAMRHLPVGVAYFLSVPFPWQFGSLRQNLVIPETAFWLLLYPLIAIGIGHGLRINRPGTVLILAATGGMCVVYALLSGNVGIAYRMRSQVWLLWAPFAAWGWQVVRARRWQAQQMRVDTRSRRLVAARTR
jgi:hypothetical protein